MAEWLERAAADAAGLSCVHLDEYVLQKSEEAYVANDATLIPTAKSIAAHFGVSDDTARKRLAQLVEEGIVSKKRGGGREGARYYSVRGEREE